LLLHGQPSGTNLSPSSLISYVIHAVQLYIVCRTSHTLQGLLPKTRNVYFFISRGLQEGEGVTAPCGWKLQRPALAGIAQWWSSDIFSFGKQHVYSTIHQDTKHAWRARSSEPEFVNVWRSQESFPPAYVAWRVGTRTLFVVPARQDTPAGEIDSWAP
jgi:hypothetical protein